MSVLSRSDIELYARDGALAPYDVLSAAEIEAALGVVAGIDTQPASLRRGLMTHKTHLVSATLASICASPAILERVAGLIGPDLLVWGSGFFLKEPRSDAYVSWHQDATYWGLEPADIVTAWVALSPSTVESGCLRVIPGSHAWPIVPHTETFAEGNLLSRGQEIAVAVDVAQARDIVLAPGQMSLHHVRIAHNSEPNRADHRRIGYAIRYVAAHVRPDGGDSALPVRGQDRFGHFEHEAPPSGEFLADDLARHAASLAGNRIAPKRAR